MPYITLYRKYRPSRFSDVINQNHIKKTLINALALSKLAHAYLFTGPRGVGKTTIGRLLARSINCEKINKTTGEACGKCSNCEEIINEKSVDIIEIDAASNRGIDEIRELREKIKYMPSKLKYRVFIIDEVHMLTIEAFNALLKTLEEPPKHVLFILATTEPQKIPATILSRCQRFDFKKISVEELIKHLEVISQKEKLLIDEDALKQIAINSDGSSRDALSLLGQVQSAFSKKKIEAEDIYDLLGLASSDLIYELLILILKKDIKNSLSKVNDLVMKGYDPKILIDSLTEFLRNIIISKNINDINNLYITDSKKKKSIEEIIKTTDNKNFIKLINYLIESKNILKYSSIPQLPIEIAIIKYIDPDEKNLEDSINNTNGNNDKIPQKSITRQDKNENKYKTSVEGNGNMKKGTINFEEIISKWSEILENIVAANYSLGLTLKSSKPLMLKNNNLIIECEYKFHKECIQNSQNREIIENSIADKVGSQVFIECVVGENNKPAAENIKTNEKASSNKSQENSTINAAMDIMGGEIIK